MVGLARRRVSCLEPLIWLSLDLLPRRLGICRRVTSASLLLFPEALGVAAICKQSRGRAACRIMLTARAHCLAQCCLHKLNRLGILPMPGLIPGVACSV